MSNHEQSECHGGGSFADACAEPEASSSACGEVDDLFRIHHAGIHHGAGIHHCAGYGEAIERVRADGVKRYLEALLERFGGNVIAAAEHADLERESFYRLCRKFAVNPPDFRREPKSKT